MRPVAGKDASTGLTRPDVPLHDFAGANTFIPSVLEHHPAFGAEVDPAHLAQGVVNATNMLRKAATVTSTLAAGDLTVRVTNGQTGTSSPTGYPRAAHVSTCAPSTRSRNVVFESGRYVFGTATLSGYEAVPRPRLRSLPASGRWSRASARRSRPSSGCRRDGASPGAQQRRAERQPHPPRGFTNTAFEAIDAAPVGAAYADGLPGTRSSIRSGRARSPPVTLWYQTTFREYVEFLRDENTTTAAGNILYTLWDQHNESVPVEMSKTYVETNTTLVTQCRRSVAKLEAKYLKRYYKEWSRCYGTRVQGISCDTASRDARIATEASRLRERLGGIRDTVCAGRNLTPGSLGHASSCPAPCASIVIFDMNDLASCSICLAEALGDEALDAAYGSTPPVLPPIAPPAALACQRSLDKAADILTRGWTGALGRCEHGNASGRNVPPLLCASDPNGLLARAKAKSRAQVDRCTSFAGLPGCATSGSAAAVEACLEAAVGAVVEPYTEVAYP
jgi:hypothetical protein